MRDGVPDGQVTGFRRPEAPAPPRPLLSRRESEPGFGCRLGLPMPPTGARPEKRVVQRTPNLGTFTAGSTSEGFLSGRLTNVASIAYSLLPSDRAASLGKER